MRVLLSTYGSRGDVEPMLALALELRARGAEVQMCAPPDFAELLAGFGVPLVPIGRSARALTKAAPAASSIPERAAEVIAAQFEVMVNAARGCDAVVATGMLPAAAGALSVAELLGIRAVSVTFQQLTLPSPRRRPLALPGRPFPPDVTDNQTLWDLDAESNNALFGQALNTSRAHHVMPEVDDVRKYVVPQLADQPYWAGRVADLGIGVAHDGPTLTTESLSAALNAALKLKTEAEAIAGTIRTDGTAVAAKLLLDGSR